jgi:hypothetical protein
MSATSDAAGLPHDNIQGKAVALIFAFPAVATLALALRVYSRAITRSFASGMPFMLPMSLFCGRCD